MNEFNLVTPSGVVRVYAASHEDAVKQVRRTAALRNVK